MGEKPVNCLKAQPQVNYRLNVICCANQKNIKIESSQITSEIVVAIFGQSDIAFMRFVYSAHFYSLCTLMI